MHDLVRARLTAIEQLCRETGVRRLDLFGSALGDGLGADSDVDFLVEFDAEAGPDLFGRFFTLKEGLERLLARPVDLVMTGSLRNPYVRQEVMATKESLYAA